MATSERELELTRALAEEELSLAVQALQDEDQAMSTLDREEVGLLCFLLVTQKCVLMKRAAKIFLAFLVTALSFLYFGDCDFIDVFSFPRRGKFL